MSAFDPVTRYVSVPLKNFEDLTARAFKVKVRGFIYKGFVVKKDGKYYAYQNLCQHLPITLDLKDEQFFTHDKSHLQCHMHGATYEIDTGKCIAGPCVGAELIALESKTEGGYLVVKIPDLKSPAPGPG